MILALFIYYFSKAKPMIALEFKEMIEVDTVYGKGYIWYMMDYGPNSDTLYTVIIKETGECWQMCHKDFRVTTNTSLGIRGNYEKPSNKSLNGSSPQMNGKTVIKEN